MKLFSDLAYTAMRIVLAFLYWSHGMVWIFGAFGGAPIPVGAIQRAAGIIELTCGTLIAIGLFTPVAAFIASGEMAFAYFIVHNPQSRFPIQNRGEITVALCFAFLYISTHGAGPFSAERIFRKGGKRR